MKNKIGLFAILAGVMTSFAGPYDAWSTYRNISVNTTTAAVTGSVTNFPLLVRLTNASAATGSDVLAASATGADIRFTDSTNTTALSYQIDRWTASAAEIWVLVPSIPGSASTSFRMYWGNNSAVSASNGAAVFDTANGFVGVWHLGNATGTNPRPSAVAGAPSAQMRNFDPGYTPVPGAIGMSDTLRGVASGTSNDYLDLGFNADFSGTNYPGYANFTTGISYSVWIYNSGPVTFERLFCLSADSSGTGALATPDRLILMGNQNNSATNPNLAMRLGVSGVQQTNFSPTTRAYTPNSWYHFFFSKAAGTGAVTIDTNGVLYGTTAATWLPLANVTRNYFWLGRSGNPADGLFRGKFDEPQLSKIPRSQDWAKLSFETQKPGATAVTLGAAVSSPPRALSYSPNPAVFTLNFAIPTMNPMVTGVATGYAVTPALPAGLTLNPTTGAITGTPTAVSAITSYLITVSNASGSDTETVRMTVNSGLVAPSGLSYTTPVTYGLNTAITPNVPTVTGTVQVYAVNPALPAGLSLNTTSGAISGLPTVVATAVQCTVTAGNGAGSTTAIVTITVIAPPSGLTYPAPTDSYPLNSIYVNKSPTVSGAVTSYTVNPALPAGLALASATGIITGVPSALQGATNHIVSANNAAGSATFTLNITVYGPPSNLTYAVNPATYNLNATITANTPTVTGLITGYTVNPPLPSGLSLNATTGVISGTPTAVTPVAVLDTVIARNLAGTTRVVLSILVQNPGAIHGSGLSHDLEIQTAGSSVVFRLPSNLSGAQISVMDIWGRTVWSQSVGAGIHEMSWNGKSEGGFAAPGIYLARVTASKGGKFQVLAEKKLALTP